MVKRSVTTLKWIVVIFIVIIISLLIYSADVFAINGLSNLKVKGRDGIDGYVKNNADVFTFSARAFIQDVTINTSQVRLLGGSATTGFPFDSCLTVGDGSVDCTFTRNMSDFSICPRFGFTINLYNQSNSLVDAKQVTAVCDNLAPTITLSTDKSLYGAEQNITFAVNIVDKAQTSSNSTECTGLQSFVSLSSDGYSRTFQVSPSGCTLSASLKETSNVFISESPTVTLTSADNFGQQAQQSTTFTTDFTPPSVVLREFDIRNIDGSPVNFFRPEKYKALMAFEISDNALNLSSFKVDVSMLNFVGGSTTPVCTSVNLTTQTCSLDNVQLQLNSSSFSGSVIASASDNAGNKKTELVNLNKTFPTDTIAPTFVNLNITQLNGSIVTVISNIVIAGITVTVDIIESGIGLKLDTVKADLNALNVRVTTNSNVPKSFCTLLESNTTNKTRCAWTNLIMDLNASTNITRSQTLAFTFRASDNAGNNVSETLTYGVLIDTLGPVAMEIVTGRFDSNGTYFVSAKNNTFIATLIETGSGINAENVFLDISALGGTILPANNCSGSGSSGQVICIWNNVDIFAAPGQRNIRLSPLTKDNAGNSLANSLEKIVMVDTIAPVVSSVSIEAVAASSSVVPGFITTGNALSITAEVQEENELTASLDASAFIQNATKINADSCSKNENLQVCTWATDEINVRGFITNRLIFNFQDVAGNSINHSVQLNVTGTRNVTVDFWRSSVGSPSPNAIDKELITKYDPFIWFPVALSTNTTSPLSRWPVSVVFDRCSGNESIILSSTTGNKPELFNFNPTAPKVDSTLPYNVFFKFTLDRALPPADSLRIPCSIKIRTLIDNKEISPDETENITFTINYFNNPLGTIDTRIDDEIERAKASWLVQGEWLDTAQQLFNVAQTICRFASYLFTVINFLAGGTDKLKACCQVGSAFLGGGFCCPMAKAFGTYTTTAVEGAKKGYQAYAAKFCKTISCQMFFGDWWKDDNGKWKPDSFFDNAYFNALSNSQKQSNQRSRDSSSVQAWTESYFANIDPKQSLVGSVAFLCLPGVIYNLQKARVIDCRYINCLKETQNGMPLYLCTGQRQYAYCKYVWGQLFNLVPFADALTSIGQRVIKALSSPFELVGTSLSVACYLGSCQNPVGPPGFCQVCYLTDTASWFTDVLCDLGIGSARCEPIWNRLSIDTDNACKDALKEDEETESSGTPEIS